MTEQATNPPRIEIVVTGPWDNEVALIAGLLWKRTGYELQNQHLVNVQTGSKILWGISAPDQEIIEFFQQGNYIPQDQLAEIAAHKIKVHITATGGSIDAAQQMFDATTALVKAGGTGVAIDNSGRAHSASDWLKLASADPDLPAPGGLYWAYVATTRTYNKDAIYTTGMHCFGLRDGELPHPCDPQTSAQILHSFLVHTYRNQVPVHDNDAVGNEDGARFHARQYPCTRFDPDTPFFNPYGIWRLEPVDLEVQTPAEGKT